MVLNINKRLFKAVHIAMVIVAMAFTPGIGPDAEAGSKNRGRSDIAYTGETPVHPGYPQLFDNVGTIGRLAAGEVVIDDSLYRLSNSAAYYVPGPYAVSRSRFKAGDRVGCLITVDGEIESIWFISRNSR
jgi:hypothetical protein